MKTSKEIILGRRLQRAAHPAPKALDAQISLKKRRSLRLRRKLRVGEFQEFGFEVSFSLRPELAEDQRMNFWDAFILEAIEPNGLAYGGGEIHGFVSWWKRGSATEEHRELIRSWLITRSEVQAVNIGPLVDSWHGGEPNVHQ